MNEIERRELKGLGGWLVLFQIQIFSTLAGTVQMLVLLPISGMLMRNQLASGDFDVFGDGVFDFFDIYYSPYTYIFAAVIFILTLLCVIFFYRKRLAFRVFFIIESAIYIIGMALYYLYMTQSMANMYTGMSGEMAPFTVVFFVFFIAFGLLPMLGIMIAFIIALFKSHRVKNTFN